jgi:hypothetical protein
MGKKLKLDEPWYSGFRGLGIVSPEKDYRISFFLNKELGLEFKKIVDDVSNKILETGHVLEKEFELTVPTNAPLKEKQTHQEEKLPGLFVYDPSKNKRQQLICFVHNYPGNIGKLYLVKNKQDGFYMLPTLKKMDYIVLEPEEQPDTLKSLKTTLLKFSFIQSCFPIPEENLKYIDAE